MKRHDRTSIRQRSKRLCHAAKTASSHQLNLKNYGPVFYIRITEIVIFLDFHSTRQVQPLVYSCSRGLDQNQMYPDRDTPGIVNRTQSNSIELNRTQSVD